MSTEAPSRILDLELVFNVRDLGGYPAAEGRHTAWRTLYRGDGIQRLAVDSLADLGVRTVLDLRTAYEIEHRGRFDGHGIGWHHLPVLRELWDPAAFDSGVTAERYLADRYLDMLEDGAESLGRSLHLLAEREQVPALFHCAAGKDRTGVLASLVLSLLGVADDVIVEDYALSAAGMERMVAYIRTLDLDADPMRDQPAAFMAAPPAAMRLFLQELADRHGSAVAFAAEVGAGADVVDSLRANLLT